MLTEQLADLLVEGGGTFGAHPLAGKTVAGMKRFNPCVYRLAKEHGLGFANANGLK